MVTHGALGSATSSIKVFQDFFVDLDLPVTLTQGDRVSLPVAVYNYLPEAQTVRLTLEKSDRYEMLDDGSREMKLNRNEVAGTAVQQPGVEPTRDDVRIGQQKANELDVGDDAEHRGVGQSPIEGSQRRGPIRLIPSLSSPGAHDLLGGTETGVRVELHSLDLHPGDDFGSFRHGGSVDQRPSVSSRARRGICRGK